MFQLVRVEEIAHGKRPGKGNIVYIVDSGRGRADGQPAAAVASALNRTTSATGELTRDEILDNITLLADEYAQLFSDDVRAAVPVFR